MSWAKIDAALDSNPKVRRAGRNGREVFLFLLRRVQLLDLAGRLPLTNVEPWYLADQLMMSEVDAADGVARAAAAGLIELGDDVCIRGWDDEWARRPMTEAERKARQRRRDLESRAVAPPVTTCHEAIVTKRDSPDCHAGEERRGEEKSREEKIGERASAPKAEPRPKARAVVMPDGWTPSPAKASEGVDSVAEFAQFRDHHAARASRFVDWDAAFRTWLRNAAKFAAGRGGRASAKSPFDLQMERVAMLEARERQEALSLDGDRP